VSDYVSIFEGAYIHIVHTENETYLCISHITPYDLDPTDIGYVKPTIVSFNGTDIYALHNRVRIPEKVIKLVRFRSNDSSVYIRTITMHDVLQESFNYSDGAKGTTLLITQHKRFTDCETVVEGQQEHYRSLYENLSARVSTLYDLNHIKRKYSAKRGFVIESDGCTFVPPSLIRTEDGRQMSSSPLLLISIRRWKRKTNQSIRYDSCPYLT
jgi:hypothetical protein